MTFFRRRLKSSRIIDIAAPVSTRAFVGTLLTQRGNKFVVQRLERERGFEIVSKNAASPLKAASSSFTRLVVVRETVIENGEAAAIEMHVGQGTGNEK